MSTIAPARRVLVADDDAAIREIITTNLESLGYQVTEAEDGEEALRLARQMNPVLIVLDIMMPELDGLGVLQHLRGHPATSDVPVVVLSALAQDRDVLAGWRAGADYYLTKPFNVEELLHFVELIA